MLKSGTHELYRDLIYPGGVSNPRPGRGCHGGLIGAPAIAQSPARPEMLAGLLDAGLGGLEHSTLDAWWQPARGIRGDVVNHLPILMIDGFFDVESRGAFQAFQQLRGDGAHLEVVGAHDSAPKGTDGGVADTQAWFDHYLAGAANGIETRPRVDTGSPTAVSRTTSPAGSCASMAPIGRSRIRAGRRSHSAPAGP